MLRVGFQNGSSRFSLGNGIQLSGARADLARLSFAVAATSLTLPRLVGGAIKTRITAAGPVSFPAIPTCSIFSRSNDAEAA